MKNNSNELTFKKTGQGCYDAEGHDFGCESNSQYRPMRWEAFRGIVNLGTFDSLPEAKEACQIRFARDLKNA